MVGMIANISDYKNTFFFSNDNTFRLEFIFYLQKNNLLVVRMKQMSYMRKLFWLYLLYAVLCEKLRYVDGARFSFPEARSIFRREVTNS